MNDVKVFDFGKLAVRVIDSDGEPWFVAAGEMRTEDDVKCFLAALAEGALQAAE